MRPTQLAAALNICIAKQRPAFVWGAPGVGKSEMIEQVAKDDERELRDVRLNLLDPTDIKGFPVPNIAEGEMTWLPADFLPKMLVQREVKITTKKTETQLVANDSRGILFLDELNQAPPSVQAAAYQLLLNRKVGNYTLPAGWAMIAAGNRETDRSNVQRMPAALALRLIHLDYEVNVDDWCDWALSQGDKVPVELLSFIRFRKDLLHNFDPTQRVSPNPRSWVFCGELTNSGLDGAIEFEMFKGGVGEAAAGEYMAFLKVFRELPTVDQIMIDPEGTPVSESPAVRFAISAALAHSTTKDCFGKMMTYMRRMEPEWQITYVRDAQRRTNRAICQTKEYIKFATEHSHLLA